MEDESDLQLFLAEGMRNAGWTVTREHTLDETKERIDILARRSDIGVVGIKAKYVTRSGPNEAGTAIDQILTQHTGKHTKAITSTPGAWRYTVMGIRL